VKKNDISPAGRHSTRSEAIKHQDTIDDIHDKEETDGLAVLRKQVTVDSIGCEDTLERRARHDDARLDSTFFHSEPRDAYARQAHPERPKDKKQRLSKSVPADAFEHSREYLDKSC
jgi:hypothetical protein